MKRLAMFLAVLALVSIACGQYITPSPTVAVTETTAPISPTLTATVPTATPLHATDNQQSAVVRAVVNVRNSPDGDIVGYLTVGDTVTIAECGELWCSISSPIVGYVWRGCLSDNPAELGCSAK